MQTISKFLIGLFLLFLVAPGCSTGQEKNKPTDAIDALVPGLTGVILLYSSLGFLPS